MANLNTFEFGGECGVAFFFTLSGFVTKPIVELTHAIRRMGKQGSGVALKDGSAADPGWAALLAGTQRSALPA